MDKFSKYFVKANFPKSFSFNELESIPSYNGRLNYARTHLKRLTSGSAREIFKVDETSVLKIAKNVKGLAQNNIEADYMLSDWYADILALVKNRGESIKDEGPFWIEMELAKPLTPSRFKDLKGYTVDELRDFLIAYGRYPISQELQDKMEGDVLAENIINMSADFDMPLAGDFGRLNSYGEVMRNGKPMVVLVDFGLTKQVYYDYYRA